MPSYSDHWNCVEDTSVRSNCADEESMMGKDSLLPEAAVWPARKALPGLLTVFSLRAASIVDEPVGL